MEQQKNQIAGLQKSSKNTLRLVKIFKPADLIGCINISDQIKLHSELNVLTEIRLSVEKCALSLNITMSEIQVVTLCEDLMDIYTYDSIEDVRECLKSGRRGEYGFGHNSRNSLNMILIREWMTLHLEKKSIEREKKNTKSKMSNKEPLEIVDYESYNIRMKKEDEEKKQEKKGSKGYNNFKAEYFQEKEGQN